MPTMVGRGSRRAPMAGFSRAWLRNSRRATTRGQTEPAAPMQGTSYVGIANPPATAKAFLGCPSSQFGQTPPARSRKRRLAKSAAPSCRYPIRTVASVAEEADSAALPADSTVAGFAGPDTAVGSEPVDRTAGPPTLPHSRPHAVPCQNLLAPCGIRSCFAPGSAPVQEVFWHQTRPALLSE
jgi:hypothetical protein